jgi:hypothetical protein
MEQVEMKEWRNENEETNKMFIEAKGEIDFISVSIIMISERDIK